MFTGIIQTVGRVKDIDAKGDSARITVEHGGSIADIKPGDSVAVDGVCLTVVEFSLSVFKADISGETLRLTTLGNKRRGGLVNLENPLTPSSPMGGHFVTGHIDGIGLIARKAAAGEFAEIDFSIPAELQGQIVKKGSVAVDGISLTVADLI